MRNEHSLLPEVYESPTASSQVAYGCYPGAVTSNTSCKCGTDPDGENACSTGVTI